jgi:hypothetical protein
MGHPRFYSATPAKGIGEVAIMRHRNAIGAHSHLQGISWSKDGRFLSIDPGHMTEAEQHAYHQQTAGLSKFPAWKQGFVLVRSNRATLCADGLIDWADFGTE